MPFSLLPTWQTQAVTDLNPEFLREQGISLVMLDFDNTIVPYTTNIPAQPVIDWLEMMKKSRLTLCVVSNSRNSRVPEFCEKYGIECITRAKKPGTAGIRRCLEKYQLSPRQAVLVGDQIYTDTLGGGCAGVRTVLVKAIHNHTVWLKLRHICELPFIFVSKNRRLPQ